MASSLKINHPKLSLTKPLLFLLSGKIGSGKNYLSEEVLIALLRSFGLNVLVVGLADDIKFKAINKHGFTFEQVFIQKIYESRKALQTIGEDACKINPRAWIDRLIPKIKLYFMRKIDVIIICDIRKDIEFDVFMTEFKNNYDVHCIRTVAPERTWKKLLEECQGNEEKALELSKHVSEIGLDHFPDEKFSLLVHNEQKQEQEAVKKVQDFTLKILQALSI